MSERIQYLTLQECKRVFFRSDYGLMRFRDMVANPDQFSLDKVYVLGVSVEGLPIHYRQYFLATNIPSVSAFLCDFWSYKSRVGSLSMPDCPLPTFIQGKPDEIVIDQRMAECLKPEFYTWLHKEKVSYQFSKSSNRKFSATVRQHQEYQHIFKYPHEPIPFVPNMEEPYQLTINELNDYEKSHSRSLSNLGPAQRRFISERYIVPMELPINAAVNEDLILLPANLSVRSNNDIEVTSIYWHPASNDESNYGYGYAEINLSQSELNNGAIDPYEQPDSVYYRQELMIALRCHEHVYERLADLLTRELGDNDYLNKLKQLKKNKYRYSPFTEKEENELFTLLELSDDGLQVKPGVFDLSKLSANETELLWNLITHGGDVFSPFEVRPQNGTDDPAYRLFAVRVYGDSINHWLLASRASRACATLDAGRCFNFEPKSVEFFPPETYRKLLKAALKWDRLTLGKFFLSLM